jgi:hypothetical protein
MHPIIFLDFDGVINSDEFPVGNEIPQVWFDSRLVTKVNDIIRQTGARLVISSDWRRGRSIQQLQDLLESYDCIGEIIGCTPEAEQFVDVWIPITALETERCFEIAEWLNNHPEVTHWVAIDDLDLSALQWFVQTNHRTGITDKDVDIAVKMLTDPIQGKHG